ncbi:hypothetical protein CBS101457_003767 [Exobasidium rhododendri]|nr:hypothetical protein CBS101457_003767 [Exobasidium rhododendri]
MAETTKRARSPSPQQTLGNESKRAKEEEEKQSAAARDSEEKSEDMASDGSVNTGKNDEVDAVELGLPHEGEEADMENKEEQGDGEGILQGSMEDSGHADADGQPANIAIRALIVTGDASVIIGKQGKHINEIREKSGAKLTISESLPGNPERILTVAGPLDAVSKAFGLIVRRINDEPFDQASVPGSRAVTIRFIVPHSRMGSVIGKQGSKIKEIQEASGARLTAGEAMLPGSTERVLNISGVADAVHIAVYYVGTILLEHQDRTANNLSYRPTAGPSRPPGAPQGFAGGAAPVTAAAVAAAGYGYPGAMPQVPGAAFAPSSASQVPPGSQTQQIFVPNDLVGCIIGKGGQKINEVRQMSGSHIKIMEPGAGIAAGGSGSERLVTITGPPANIQMAVQLLYQRLEQEKLR